MPAGQPSWRQVLQRLRRATRSQPAPGAGTPICRAVASATSAGKLLATSSVAPPGLGSRLLRAYTPRDLAEKILTSRSALEGERKQVTVLFADMKVWLELLADRDPEDGRKLLDPVLERMMEAVHRYEGTVNQVMGDGIMALFGAPLAHEDHAVRACYAALAMQQAIRRLYRRDAARARHRGPDSRGSELRGGGRAGDGSDLRMDYSAVGQTTHLAARMEQLATPGSTRLTGETLRLAEGFVEVVPIGPVPVKGGMASPVEAFELAGPSATRTRLPGGGGAGAHPVVGATQELDHLRQALGKGARGAQGQVVAAVGEPGVGKSRLLWEFIHSHRTQGWLVLEIELRLLRQGQRLPARHRPLQELLPDRGARRRPQSPGEGDGQAPDARRIAACHGAGLPLTSLDASTDDASWDALDPGQRRRRTIDGLRRMLLRESQVQPLCLVFEDLHWIQPETQGLLDALVESLPTARLLLLVNYRPEYGHAWGSKTYYSQLRLDPLPAESADELLRTLLGEEEALEPLKRLLVERTEGVPLCSSRKACGRSWRRAPWPANAAVIAWRAPSTPSRCRPRCRPSSPCADRSPPAG